MLRYSRLTFVSVLLLLALLVPTNVVQAQAVPQVPNDKNVAPSANLAIPDEVAQAVKLRSSLTAEQISKMQAILESHKEELKQISDYLANLDITPSTQDKKLFLPLVNAAGNTQSQVKAADLAVTSENAEKLRQITLDMAALQDKIDQQVITVLTPAQNEAYTKSTAKLKSASKVIANKLQAFAAQSPDGTDALSDCYNGAYWSGYSYFFAYYAQANAFANYIFAGTLNSYYSNLYSRYAFSYAVDGLLHASGAYWDTNVAFGYDSNDWSGLAYNDLVNANYYAYYGYLNGYYSWLDSGKTSTLAYNAYYYGYYANYYAYYAYINENNC